MRSAPSLLICAALAAACAGSLGAAESGPAATDAADIELRKSFRFIRRAGRQVDRTRKGGDMPAAPRSRVDAGPAVPSQLGAVAAALGEHLISSGTLHLPGVGAAGTVLHGATTPVLETATGRRVIIDRDRTITPEVADQIGRRWPDFAVVQPPADAKLRDVLGAVLEAARYESVLRAAPLTFGRGVTVRYTPDFVVLRTDRDLLLGEARAISIVDPGDALAPELRELAAQLRVQVVELAEDGSPVGAQRPPWRDPVGRVTTMETARLTSIIGEIAATLGCSVQRRAPLPALPGEPAIVADLLISLAGDSVPVFEKGDPGSRGAERTGEGAAIVLKTPADLSTAIGSLLGKFALPTIGPAVEFYRARPSGSARRFVLTVPGWLAETGGRRLLITGAALPQLARLFLTREGIDIFEYRVAGR
jgi:hypothetical protein